MATGQRLFELCIETPENIQYILPDAESTQRSQSQGGTFKARMSSHSMGQGLILGTNGKHSF